MKNKYIGNRLITTGQRIYKVENEKSTLISWSIRCCKICKKFLSKHQLKYCKKCAKTVHQEQNVKCNTKHKDRVLRLQKKSYYACGGALRKRIYRHVENYNIGDII